MAEPLAVRPGINHIVLKVRDVDRAVAFYQQLFGYVEEMERFGDGTQAFLHAPGSESHHDLSVLAVGPDAPRPPRGATGLYHFAVEVATIRDLAEARRRLLEIGAYVAEFDTGATKSVYGRDPDGNPFEIMWTPPRDAWGEGETKGLALPLDLEAELERWS